MQPSTKERHLEHLCLFRSKKTALGMCDLLGPEDAENFPSHSKSCVWFVPPREENIFPALIPQDAERVGMLNLLPTVSCTAVQACLPTNSC